MLFLDLRIIGEHGLNVLLALEFSGDIVVGDSLYQRAVGDDADEVRDHHEAVRSEEHTSELQSRI